MILGGGRLFNHFIIQHWKSSKKKTTANQIWIVIKIETLCEFSFQILITQIFIARDVAKYIRKWNLIFHSLINGNSIWFNWTASDVKSFDQSFTFIIRLIGSNLLRLLHCTISDLIFQSIWCDSIGHWNPKRVL
jgi:hypothetical protein